MNYCILIYPLTFFSLHMNDLFSQIHLHVQTFFMNEYVFKLNTNDLTGYSPVEWKLLHLCWS